MDFFSAEFFSSFLSIVLIDLVLGGDNAIVIGLAARNLPEKQQKQAILWGSIGAITIRVLSTAIVVWLLKIPGLLFAGGLVLVWMAYKLLVGEKDYSQTKTGNNLMAAIGTIIVADAAMGIDNVLAVAGASHGSLFMVALGLLISMPIVMWGSALVVKIIERFPFIIYLASGVIAYTAATMMLDEPFLQRYFEHNPVLEWSLVLTVVMGVIVTSKLRKHRLQ